MFAVSKALSLAPQSFIYLMIDTIITHQSIPATFAHRQLALTFLYYFFSIVKEQNSQ
jgi:hypothetical protein